MNDRIVNDLYNELKKELELLESWILMTREGGYSTHIVRSMEERAMYLKVKLTYILK